jgi:hypothetical protein
MEKITSEVQHSSKTINDLLELARSRPPKRRVVDSRPFVVEAVAAANLPPGVDVAVDVPEGLGLDADPDQPEPPTALRPSRARLHGTQNAGSGFAGPRAFSVAGA